MTAQEVIATIRAEIERQKEKAEKRPHATPLEGFECIGKIKVCNELLSFLSTLESEKPVPNGLEEAATITLDEAESVADEYTGFLEKGLIENQPRPIGGKWFIEYARKRFITGAEWQAEHAPLPEDTVLFNKGVEEGKRLMMEDAVEGEVLDLGINYLDLSLFDAEKIGIKEGDKVRIIIVKEQLNHFNP